MGSKPCLYPDPTYRPLETSWDSDEDTPVPRCGHTLTAVATTKTHGARLIFFGGATASSIRLPRANDSVHFYDVLSRKRIRLHQSGDTPSPRAAHSAAAAGTMVVFQCGTGPAGHSTDN
ncbi:serine threonine- phosphatase BSL1-like isoform X1 [Olea europaea subsp. europaea]|uniref:Serine threonine- phosphatase BSL1-like isoform X1 n=1 Tax=Olea europaea subsp. europaea TaxID=158383 RepID=A0A8S0T7S6_OLEEU|nr:serine threonine- phosphatase BSL1-like isoform X1 [Olea europaea subsp. europaea]